MGISIRIHITWLLVLALVSWTLATEVFPSTYEHWSEQAYWAIGVIAAVLLFGTVLLHELAHAVVARRRGLEVPSITLFIFGGVSSLGGEPKTAGEEAAIAIAGPVTSFVIAGAALGVALIGGQSEKVQAIFSYLAMVNVILGVFNLLPGFPLDGGRVLRAIVWKRSGSFRTATRRAAEVGKLFAYGLMLLGVVFLVSGLVVNGIWFMVIGWFLLGASQSESAGIQFETVLSKLRAADVMTTAFATARPGDSILSVVDQQMVGQGERAVVVVLDGRVMGIATISDVQRLPREAWAGTPVQAIMTAREQVSTVSPDTSAFEVLTLLGKGRLNQVPVIGDGQLVGMVTRRELIDRIHISEVLTPRS
jgi:Zn-dependent protease